MNKYFDSKKVVLTGNPIRKNILNAKNRTEDANKYFNLSNKTPTKIIDAAKIIYNKINPNKKLNIKFEKPYLYDVQKRSPNVDKAKKILGFEAKTTLDESLNEIIPWIKDQIKLGEI